MITITIEHLLQLHVLVLNETGGAAGLRDLGRLEAAVACQEQVVFDEELYPEIFDKAAAIIRGVIADHPFVDGNKRTAMLAGITLLKLNKLEFIAEQGAIEDFAVYVATKKYDVPKISTWLKANCK